MKKLIVLYFSLFFLISCGKDNIELQTDPLITDNRDIKIMIASDLHYLSKELYSLENETFVNLINSADGKMTIYSEEIIDAFIENVKMQKPDVLILSGDLTFNGEKESHKALATKLSLLKENGITVLVIPGNHDLGQYKAVDFSANDGSYTRSQNIDAKEFTKIYKDYGYNNYYSKDENSLSYSYLLSDKYRLLFIDVNGNNKYNSITDDGLLWVEQQLSDAKSYDQEVIIISHQNLLIHNSLFYNGYTITNYQTLQTLFSEYSVNIGFSGHIHIQDIAYDKDFFDIALSSLSIVNNQYGLINLTSDGHMDYQALGLEIDLPINSYQFFYDISYNKAYDYLSDYEYEKSKTHNMSVYFAEVNTRYFRGDLTDSLYLYQNMPEYSQWFDISDEFMGSYLISIVSRTHCDNLNLSINIK